MGINIVIVINIDRLDLTELCLKVRNVVYCLVKIWATFVYDSIGSDTGFCLLYAARHQRVFQLYPQKIGYI